MRIPTRTLPARLLIPALAILATAWLGVFAASAQNPTSPAAPPGEPEASTLPTESDSDSGSEFSTGEPFENLALISTEQGQTPLDESFEWDRREWRLERRRDALRDTQFKINPRLFYFHRDQYDGSVSEALAIGGSVGLRTGYFFDHLSIGLTGYTSQPLYAPDDKDGTLLLEPGQNGYTVLGELYADVRIVEDLNLYVGRKEFDTPFINRNDTRMTPNTFEAAVIQGRTKIGDEGALIKGGIGYFNKIKERNADTFVSMSEDAGASVERGVTAAGGVYEKGNFTFGAVDYYSADIINIGYVESTLTLPIDEDWKPRLAAQFIDQRSVGSDLLDGEAFSGQQYGLKADVPFGNALFTTGYTATTDGTKMRNPWSGYPGYTSVQVEDFNRAGEEALLLRLGYEFPCVDGLSTYALWVHGSNPELAGERSRDEYDFNLQWGPTEGVLKGLAVRLRYAIVEQSGSSGDDLNDFRVILNYGLTF